ncbi:hypothetical protein KAS50_08045 [bacterium]|nr:hypothetical protein [bacterium]
MFALIFLLVPFPYFAVYGDDNGEDVNKFINSFSIFKNTRFNRVDGLFVGFELETIPVAYPDFTFLTRFGYSFILQKPGFLFDVERKFGEEKKIAVSVFYREETVSNEDHIVSTIKNSVSAFLIKKDYKDYYYIKGGGLKLSYIINEKMTVRFRSDVRSYSSLSNGTDWSLFNSGSYRVNPLITPGDEVYTSVSLSPEFQESLFIPFNMWHYNIIIEKGWNDFEYAGIGIMLKRYQYLFKTQPLVAHLYVHSRTKTIAEQHLIDLGGLSTLRGYGYKEFTGNRIMLFNVDYFFGRSILQKIPLSRIPLYDMLDIVAFFDAGKAVIAGSDDSIFEGFSLDSDNKIKSNFGFGVTVAQGLLRFNMAKRLDRKTDSFSFTLRFMRKM